MKKLLTRACVMAGMLLGTYLVLTLLPIKNENIYASVRDKHQRLAAIGSPKIVLIGGSSLALGVDSALIEAQTGLPVVNMAVNGGFGLRYMLDEVRPMLGAGDIIVLAPEYEHWHGSLLDGGLNMLWAIQANPATLADLSSPQQVAVILRNTPEFMQGKLMQLLPGRTDPVYTRSAFDAYGDFTAHLDLPQAAQLGGLERIADQPFNPDTAAVVRAFAAHAAARGARVLYTFPPLAAGQVAFADNADAIYHIERSARAIEGLQVIDAPTRYILPDQLFFDTVYHLRRQGRQLRSELLAASLNAVLAPRAAR